MSTVSSTTATTPATTTTDTSAAGTALSGDYTMFLKLLTTQMQNQDPLSPMDTSQYTQQLVQYSQVEQSIQQNTNLKSILSSLSAQSLTQNSMLIGGNAEFDSATAGLNGSSPATWNWSSSTNVSSLTATIHDAKGHVVDTRQISTNGTSGNLSWGGSLASGDQAPDGAYTLELTGTDSYGNAVDVTPHATGVVKDVRLVNGVVSLGVNGIQIPASSVVGVGS